MYTVPYIPYTLVPHCMYTVPLFHIFHIYWFHIVCTLFHCFIYSIYTGSTLYVHCSTLQNELLTCTLSLQYNTTMYMHSYFMPSTSWLANIIILTLTMYKLMETRCTCIQLATVCMIYLTINIYYTSANIKNTGLYLRACQARKMNPFCPVL